MNTSVLSFRRTVEDLYRVPVLLAPLAIENFSRLVGRDGSIHLPYAVNVADNGEVFKRDDDGFPEHASICVDFYDWQLKPHQAGSGKFLPNMIDEMRTKLDAEVAKILWQARAKRSVYRDTFHIEIAPQVPTCSAPQIHFAAGASYWSWQGLFANYPEQKAAVAAALALD